MELMDYLKVIRTRWWYIALPVVLIGLGALALSLTQEPVYEGVAQVLVSQPNAGVAILGLSQPQSSYQPNRDDVATQVEIIQSVRVAGQVVESLDLDMTAGSLLRRVEVSSDTGTNVVTIRVTDASASRAADIANSFADAYVAWSRDSQRESLRAAADDVELRLKETQVQIVAAEVVASAPSVSRADEVRLDAAQALYATLADNLQELRIAEQLATGTGSVLSTATVGSAPVSPNPRRDGTLGVSVGLLIGLGLAFLAEQLDNRIGSAEEVGTIYGAPVLARIPMETLQGDQQLGLTLVERPDASAAEAYRVLRNNLDFLNVDKDIKAILVTSAAPSEGKSTVAANLAAVLSQAGMRVILVACDFHRPTTGGFFKLGHAIGLSDVLQGKWDLWTAAQRVEGVGDLWVLTAGTVPPNSSALLGSEAMGRLLADMRNSVDWVILDSAPVLATADATAVARWVDGVLVVAQVGVSTRDDARAGCEHLLNVGSRILGVVAWGRMDGGSAHSYNGQYGYVSR